MRRVPAAVTILALVGVVAASLTLAQQTRDDQAFASLFNGKDLAGWKATAPGKFLVEDGCLIGTQDDGKGADLATEKEFDNFELRVTYKVKWPANSGFWFRFDPKKGLGYQYDVLKYKNPVAYSGTLYCPGKMFVTKNLVESLENRDGWNEARIWANGAHLILWLNGKRVGECDDTTLTRGAIGIQVHGGNDMKGMKITVKEIKIRPVPADEKPPVLTDAEKVEQPKDAK